MHAFPPETSSGSEHEQNAKALQLASVLCHNDVTVWNPLNVVAVVQKRDLAAARPMLPSEHHRHHQRQVADARKSKNELGTDPALLLDVKEVELPPLVPEDEACLAEV